MNLKILLNTAIKLCKKQPEKKIVLEDKTTMTLKEISVELSKFLQWVYPKLDTCNIKKIVFCERCKYYKKYRKKGTAVTRYLCSLDKSAKQSDFYCADGIEREET